LFTTLPECKRQDDLKGEDKDNVLYIKDLKIVEKLPLQLEGNRQPLTKCNETEHDISLEKDTIPWTNCLKVRGNGTLLKPKSMVLQYWCC